MALSEELLKGGIDLHTHSGPGLFERSLNDFELAAEARDAGMRAVLLKAHESTTVIRASLVATQIPDIQVFGGLVLNYFVGGLNPYAVDASIKMGAKMIWMPTLSAENHLRFYGGVTPKSLRGKGDLLHPREGIKVVDEDGQIKPQVKEILKLIAEADIALGTGHLSIPETKALVRAAKELGVRKILVTHPDLKLIAMPLEDQIELAEEGAYLEKTLLTMMPMWYSISPAEMARTIKAIGAERCVMTTDFGQLHHPRPVEGMRLFIQMMLECGITSDEIYTMLCINPAALLGLS